MITPPAHSSYTTKAPIFRRLRFFFSAGLLAIGGALYAQDGHVYAVGIRFQEGGPTVSGFLQSVTDSAVTIIPGRTSPKGLKAALAHSQPITIPRSLIKKLAVARVRTGIHMFFSSLLVAAGYSVAYVLLVPIETPAGFVLYGATITTATLLTLNLMYVRNYKPTEPGFTTKMQEFCLVKSGLAVDGQ